MYSIALIAIDKVLPMLKALYGSIILLITTALWGSSFIFIKLTVSNISGFSYTFYRTLISVAALTPIIILKYVRESLQRRGIVSGLVTGASYFLGLLLQGIGTIHTSPSVSAFITGLNTVHVHVYSAFTKKRYSLMLFVSLVFAIVGLYMITDPVNGLGFGEFMVFLGSIAWAAEILLVSKYAKEGVSRVEFLYGLLLPSLLLAPYVIIFEKTTNLSLTTWVYLTYLALVCTLFAVLLQIIGQKYVSEATAAIIYILEPVFAMIFSLIFYHEEITSRGVAGSILMLIASAIAVIDEICVK
ncbi:MAG: DMT family transporter [Ignisphaera sp.]